MSASSEETVFLASNAAQDKDDSDLIAFFDSIADPPADNTREVPEVSDEKLIEEIEMIIKNMNEETQSKETSSAQAAEPVKSTAAAGVINESKAGSTATIRSGLESRVSTREASASEVNSLRPRSR